MKLGINGATMRPWPLEKQIERSAAAGFQGLEIWRDRMDEYFQDHEIEELMGNLQEHNLEAFGIVFLFLGYHEGREERLKAMRKWAAISSRLGSPGISVCAAMPPEGLSKAEAIESLIDDVKAMATVAEDHGVKLILEPIGSHPVTPGPKEAMQIIEGAGKQNVRILFDVYHYHWSDIPLEDIRSTPVDLIEIIHVNDCPDIPREEMGHLERLYPTLGTIPLKEMLEIPRGQRYDGWISVEVFQQEYWDNDPELAMNSMKYLNRLLDRLPWR